jgi:acyl phosphate:glycerol-3-phosphate acyltransferase
VVNWVLAAIIGYLLGSIPVGFLAGRTRGIDIRQYGSGATGGTNVMRTLGVVPALLTALTDVLKGVAGAYVGHLLTGESVFGVGYAVGGLMAVVGHSYPVWLRFKGGKSVATGAGSLIPASPVAFGCALFAFLATVVPTRLVSLGSLVGAMVLGLVIVFDGSIHAAIKVQTVATVAIVYVRHWENMKRLAAGTENKLGQKAKPRAGQ